MNDLTPLVQEAQADFERAGTPADLENAKARYLGKAGRITEQLKALATLAPDEKKARGALINAAKQQIEAALNARRDALADAELQAQLKGEALDVSLPGRKRGNGGGLHPISRARERIEAIFGSMGFDVADGPEIETDWYSFTALNNPENHPARSMQDTFYVDPSTLRSDLRIPSNGEELPPGPEDVVLRTHTSPMQVRAMEAHPPPLYVVIPGRVYRPDSDATHTPQFHQIEGLAVDEDITLADLKGTLLMFARAVFGDRRDVRLRPHFFPFTEPSVEVDVSCFHCDGKGFLGDGSRCYLCKGEGWLEVLGAGEVDPNVYSYVPTSEANAPGYDPEKVQGFAWGLGVERIAMLKHGIPDLRLYYENDLRFLDQFS